MGRTTTKRAPADLHPPSGDVTPLPPDDPLVLTVFLRHRQHVRRRPGSSADLSELTQRVTPEALQAQRAKLLKRPVEKLRRFADRHGMTLLDVDFLRRCATVAAKVSDAEEAFGTKLFHIGAADERRYFPSPPPRLPPALAEIAHAVVGLDTRPLKSGRLRQHGEITNGNGLYPSEIAALYDIARGGGGAGQCIAIIEPAGGYDPADVAEVCNAMHVPTPQIVDINVGLGRNRPGQDIKADLEVALDIQVVAGVAPEAHIAFYFTELNELGLLAGLSEAVHGLTFRPNVIVITWGEPEVFWPAEERIAFDAVLQDAARLGISVITTAGDDLATERMNDGRVHVNYPASSPYVLGCGGTAVTLDAARKAIASEVVWNDKNRRGTGGGISDIYRRVPNFQSGAALPVSLNDGKPGRGVPDVAAAASEINGYRIVFGGVEVVMGGTSAVAPLWGAFIALLNEQRGQALGFLNSKLYQTPGLFKEIVTGDNVDEAGLGYAAGPGWNACTGLGSPSGKRIFAALTAIA